MNIIINWFLTAAAIFVTAYILPGITIDGLVPTLVLAVVLGAIGAFIRPVLLVLTFPLTVATFGLFALVVNTLLIMLAGYIVPGVSIAGFWWAFLFGIVLAFVSALLKGFQK